MKKLAIFDLGNVLFEADFSKAVRYWAKAANTSEDRILSRISEDEIYRKFERGEIDPDEYFKLFKNILGLDISIDEIINGWNSVYGPVYEENYKAIIEISRSLKIVALTNTNITHCKAWEVLFKDQISVFDKIYISSEIGMRKPEHRIFHHVLSDNNVNVEESVFFDDLESNTSEADILGIEAVIVNSKDTIQKWLEKQLDL